MLKLAACLVLISGCVVGDDTAESSTEQGVHGDSDGWGEWCDNPPNTVPYNVCLSVNGEEGVCAVGVCRRKCATSHGGCPAGFQADVFWDACVCNPAMHDWDNDYLAPAVKQ